MTFEEMQTLSKVRHYPYKINLDEEELSFIKTLDERKIKMLMSEFVKSRYFTEDFLREWKDYFDFNEVVIWQVENISKHFVREFGNSDNLISIAVVFSHDEIKANKEFVKECEGRWLGSKRMWR